MKTKTSELNGAALDWAVGQPEDTRGFIVDGVDRDWMPSSKWAQGGPIIDREGIEISPDGYGGWNSAIRGGDTDDLAYGSTPLIAAMRCYVASRLGDEVEVPEGLV